MPLSRRLDAVRALRRPPFAADSTTSASTSSTDETDKLWRARVADAAKLAADELEDELQLRGAAS
jgi:hypothetical protein